MAQFVKPMLAQAVDVVPEGPLWALEGKCDGWRTLAGISTKGVWMETREGKRISSVPYIAEALRRLLPHDTVLDGEIVDLVGEKQWNRTQKILARHEPHDGYEGELTYVIFDVVYAAGHDLRREPLSTRRKALEVLLQDVDYVNCLQLAQQFESNAEGLERFLAAGWEGVVCKRLDSTYAEGQRNRGWVKCKPFSEIDAICTGTYEATPGSKYEGRAVGGITFRVVHEDGREYEGRAAGMGDRLREELYRDATPYIGLVVEIGHLGIGDEGALRHPQLRRFRDPADKAGVRQPYPLGRRVAQELVGNGPSGRIRNYRQMKDPKLIRVYDELLEVGSEAHGKALMGSGDPERDIEVVRGLLVERGLIPA